MALDPVVLDDLVWDNFTAAALLRIPAASGGLWTLNAPVDPGITLVDLFAWLLEQRVYWMDQVSDPLTRAILTLMGIPPKPAQAATTVLHVRVQSNTPVTPGAVTLESGTLVQPAKSLNPPIFTTREDVTVYPLAPVPGSDRSRMPGVSLTVGGSNKTDNLTQGRSPALIDANGGETAIVIPFDPGAPPGAGKLSLFIELLTPTPTGPGPVWALPMPSTTEPAIPSPLTWLVTVNGTLIPLDSTKVIDGTLGLRQSGIVQLPIPDGWSAPAATPPGMTTAGFAIVLRASATNWTTPPRVSRLIPNVVSAIHSRPATEAMDPSYIQSQITNWRRLPGNVFVLPATARPCLASTVQVDITEWDQTSTTPTHWNSVDDLGTAGPDDRVYVLDAASARLRFGDGVTGRLPIPKDNSSVHINYCVGGGQLGNLARGLLWSFPGPGITPLRAWNVVPATGGQDPETLDQVRKRAPEVLKSTGRAITAADFAEVAIRTKGTSIARAVAGVGRHDCFPNQVVPGAVTVYIVPDVPRNADGSPNYGPNVTFPAGPAADGPTQAAVLAALNEAKMLTSEVFVASANYRQVTLNLTITASPTDRNTITTSLNQALQKYFDPFIGGDDGSGWPFGGPIRPSTLLQIAQRAIGAAGTVSAVTITLDDPPGPAEGCIDVKIGPTDLVVLSNVNLSLESPAAGQGGLR
jgi:hypothetical protein